MLAPQAGGGRGAGTAPGGSHLALGEEPPVQLGVADQPQRQQRAEGDHRCGVVGGHAHANHGCSRAGRNKAGEVGPCGAVMRRLPARCPPSCRTGVSA